MAIQMKPLEPTGEPTNKKEKNLHNGDFFITIIIVNLKWSSFYIHQIYEIIF